MKIADAKIVGELVIKRADKQLHIAAVRAKAMELSFGSYAFTVAKSIEDDLRSRVIAELQTELEQIETQLVTLGVEL